MKYSFLFIIIIVFFYACHNGLAQTDALRDSLIKDSIAKKKAIDKQMKLGERPEKEEMGPTGDEVLSETLASYNKIEKTDTSIAIGKDLFKIHLKYYCLHDSTLIVPKKYNWWQKPKKNFRTNNFAAKIWIVKNQDTIFNRLVDKNLFDNLIPMDNDKSIHTIVSASFSQYEPVKKEFVFNFSVSVPMTDVGIGTSLKIGKDGSYQVSNN